MARGNLCSENHFKKNCSEFYWLSILVRNEAKMEKNGATTFSIMTFSITTFSITTFSITTFSITTFSIATFSITTISIMTLSIKGLFVTLSINDIQHKRHSTQQECYYAECLYTDCRDLLIVMPNAVMLSVLVLNVVAPKKHKWNFNVNLTLIIGQKKAILLFSSNNPVLKNDVIHVATNFAGYCKTKMKFKKMKIKLFFWKLK